MDKKSETEYQTESLFEGRIASLLSVGKANNTWVWTRNRIFGVVLTFAFAYLVSCTSTSTDADKDTRSLNSDQNNSADAARLCQWPKALEDAGPGMRACGVGLSYVECSYPSGAGCGCITDGSTTCSSCGPESRATCTNRCAADEYAVSCGGPPILSPDGSVDVSYQEVPEDCVVLLATPAGNVYACCPCE